MELSDVQALTEKVSIYADRDFNEANTKQALIVPFVKMLGYDTGNPLEVQLEYDASFGVKKDAKVDIAIMQNETPIILIECKPLQASLDVDKVSQLFAYFAACPDARIGILTNGREYQFFCSVEDKAVMDRQPFLTVDLLKFDKKALPALQKMCKTSWDPDSVIASANRLKNLATIKAQIKKDALEPDEEVIKHFTRPCHDGWITKSVIDQFRPLVVQAFRDFVNDCIADRLADTEDKTDIAPAPEPGPEPEPEPVIKDGIVTHDSEVQGYVTVKALLRGVVDPSRVVMHDYKGFCSVQLDGKPSKTICRFYWFEPIAEDGSIGKSACVDIQTAGKQGGTVTHPLGCVDDLLPLADELAQAVRAYLDSDGK